MSQKKAGTLLSYIAMAVRILISILYTPVMIRFLGDAEYGVYNISYSVISYLGLLSLGFAGAYVKFYYRYKTYDDKNSIAKLNGLFMSFYLLVFAIALFAGNILANNIGAILQGKLSQSELELSSKLMKILVINIAVTFPASLFESYMTAVESFIVLRIISIVRHILSPLLGIPLLLLGYRSVGLSLAITVATVCSLVLNAYYCIKKSKMKFNFKKPDFRLFREIAVFSSFIFLNIIIDQINWNVDKVIIGKFVGSVAVATYSIGALVNQQFISTSTAVSNVFIPQVNSIVAEGYKESKCVNRELTLLMTRIGRIQYYILMLLLIGFATIGDYFLTSIWLDDTYSTSYYVALLLVVPATVPLIQNAGLEIQRAKNMHVFRSILYLLVAIFNVAISIPLSKKYGDIGAAVGTAIGLVIGNIFVMNWYYHKRIGLDMKYFWKSISQATIGMLPAMALSVVFLIFDTKGILTFLVKGVFIVLTYVFFVWKFSFNNYEKKLLLRRKK